jgi:molybdenum cofactor synthesis domain-containing protein
MQGTVKAVCTSERKGIAKASIPIIHLRRGLGIEGDAHAGTWHRQVSLLSDQDVDTMRERGATLKAGDFGENVVTEGIALLDLAVGRRFRIGPDAVLQVTQHGKECHAHCAIYHQVGDCIMPRRGIFARVLRDGPVAPGDRIATDVAYDRIRFAVVTLSDRGASGERPDTAGPLAASLLEKTLGARPVEEVVLPDDRAAIAAGLTRLCDDAVCDLVVTTGGTGLSPRDVTPEATRDVIDREVPGLGEAMRAAGLAKTPRALLSRGLAGQRGPTLIVNLSGSPKAVKEQLEAILPVLPHAILMATGIPQDCASLPDEHR